MLSFSRRRFFALLTIISLLLVPCRHWVGDTMDGISRFRMILRRSLTGIRRYLMHHFPTYQKESIYLLFDDEDY